MKKSILLFCSLLVLLQWGKAQIYSHYCVGDSTDASTTVGNGPFHPYCKYGWSRTLYLASELPFEGTTRTVTHIAWRSKDAITKATDNVSIYFKLTTATAMSDIYANTNYIDPASDGATAVWSGTVPAVAAGEWADITLTNSFYVPEGYGLLVYVDNQAGAYSNSGDFWYAHTVSSDLIPYCNQSDGELPSTGSESDYRPTTRFTLLPILDIGYIVPLATQSFGLNLFNATGSAITSAVLGWKLNGVLKSNSIAWSGSIASGVAGVCSIGSYTPKTNAMDTIKVWVNSINGTATSTPKDTLTAIVMGTNDIILDWREYIPDTVYTTGPFDIKIKATSLGDKTISSMNFVYSVSGGADNTLAMTDNGGGIWTVTCPNIPFGSTLDYRVTTVDYLSVPITISKTSYINSDRDYLYIGDTNTTKETNVTPMNTNYYYSWSRMLYRANEVGGKTLYNIAFRIADDFPYTYANQSCYMKVVDMEDLSAEDNKYHDPVADGATLVWSGSLPSMQKGEWFDIALSSPLDIPTGKGVLVYYNQAVTSSIGSNYKETNWYQSHAAAANLASGAFADDDDAGVDISSGAKRGRPVARLKMDNNWLPNSVALEDIISLKNGAKVSQASNPLTVQIRNTGSNNLNCAITYSINGGTPVSYNYTGNLLQDFIDTVNIDAVYLSKGENKIKVWVEKPNGQTDPINDDDTITITVYAGEGLSAGVYTIGASDSADYSTFSAFSQDLQRYGVAVHGIFKLNFESGTYSGIMDLSALSGVLTDEDALIITSKTGNAADVTFAHTATNVFVLGGNYNVTLKDITINASSGATIRGVYVKSACANVDISGCVFNMSASATKTTGSAIYSESTGMGDIRIVNNTFNDGYGGAYLIRAHGTAPADLADVTARITIIGNTFNRFRYYGVYLTYSCVDWIADNVFTSASAALEQYAIRFNYNRIDSGVVYNKVLFQNTKAAYGIYSSYANTSAMGTSTPALVANNEIRKLSGAGNSYGIYHNYGNNNYFHNTIYMASTAFNYGLYINYSTASMGNIKNNIFATQGTGAGTVRNWPIYGSTAAKIKNFTLAYNDYYGKDTIGYAGAAKTTISAWNTTVTTDANSVSTDPGFANISTDGALSSYSVAALQAPNVGVSADINGMPRGTNSSMGAYAASPSGIISDGTTTYTDLASAINACNTAGTGGSPYTLTVRGNATLGTTATIDKNIVINVKSSSPGIQRTITRSATAGYINVTTGTLNLSDMIFDGAKGSYTASNAMLKIASNVTMNNCVIRKCKSSGNGGAIYISAGTLDFDDVSSTIGGTYDDKNEAVNGGGLYVAGGTVNFNTAPDISYNTATTAGGAIYINSGTVNIDTAMGLFYNKAANGGGIAINGGNVIADAPVSISGDTASGNGGGLYVTGGTITCNSALSVSSNYGNVGGGIFASSGTLNLYDGATVAKNYSVTYGAGIKSSTGTIKIGADADHPADLLVYENIAKTYGGGILKDSTGTFVCYGKIKILDNVAQGNYGSAGIRLTSGTITCYDDMEISGNRATYTDGGVDNGYAGAITIAGGTLTCNSNLTMSNNTAVNRGGAVYTTTGTLNCSGTLLLSSNSCSTRGGAWFSTGNFTLNNSGEIIVTNNTAGTNGGGFYVDGATLTLKNATFINNEATNNGGAIYVASGTLTFNTTASTIGGNAVNKNTAANGAGLYVGGGTVNFTVIPNISYNVASGNGGGIFTAANLTLPSTMTLSHNTAGNGGGLYVNAGTTTLTNNTFTLDSATNGGAIYINGGTLTFSTTASTIGGSSANKNTATNGAGLYVGGGTVNFNITTNITYNEATVGNGGGVCIAGGAVNTTKPVNVSNNSADNGGGMAMTGGTLAVNNTTTTDSLKIYNNTATTNGGGLYIAGATINNTYPRMTVYNNTAANGGGICANTGINTITNLGMVRNNTATIDAGASGGGGILNIGTTDITGNAVIKANTARRGGGIYTKTGSLSLGAATIADNTNSILYGGGVYMRNGSIVLDGTIVQGNSSIATDQWGGGGIYIHSGTATIKGITATSNTTSANGGAVYVNGGTLTFSTTASTIGGSSANKNTALNGAGLYVAGGTVNFTVAPNITYNEASGNGGGVTVAGGTLSVPVLTTVSNNQANYGGGMALTGGTLTVTGTDTAAGLRLTANTTVKKDGEGSCGGGLFYANGTITDNSKPNIVINKNTAFQGGGIYCEVSASGAKTLGNIGMIWGNTASDRGGGIYYKGNNSSDATTLSNAITIKNNTADTMGGGVYVEANPLTFAGAVEINNNTTTKTTAAARLELGGAGICNLGTVNFTGSSVQIHHNTTSGHGGGIFNYGGTINCTGGNLEVTNNNTRTTTTTSSYRYYGRGGGIYDTLGTITVGASGNAKNLVVMNNKATTGGGIQISNDATITCWGDITVKDDTVTSYGGGIHNSGGTIDCKGTCSIDDNGARNVGAGIYNLANTTNYKGNMEVVNNYGGNNGGGIYNNGTANFSNGTLTVNNNHGSYGGGMYNNGTVNCSNNATVNNNYGTYGGGIYNNGPANYGSTLTVNNNSGTYGGGIYNNGVAMTINGVTTIKNNTARTNPGGGVYNTGAAAVFTCKDSADISYNTSASTGGGIYTTTSGSQVILEGGASINHNTATSGGGIKVDNAGSIVTVGKDGTPKNLYVNFDTARTSYGGGISNIGIFTVYGNLTATNDTAATTGGGIYNTKTFSVTGNAIIDTNNTGNNGGGIYNEKTTTIEGTCHIRKNKSGSSGGGIYNSSAVTIQGAGTISYNQCTIDGGGIFNSSAVTIQGVSTISNNQCGQRGGGIFNSSTLTLQSASTISYNQSDSLGGGLYTNKSFICNGNLTVSNNVSVDRGGGIYKSGTGANAFTCDGNLVVSDNVVDTLGGGMYKTGPMTCNGNMTLSGNSAAKGGGFYGYGDVTMGANKTITISNNHASIYGGGIYTSATSTVTNFGTSDVPTTIIIDNNTAGRGGGFYHHTYTVYFYGPTTFSNNVADTTGGGWHNESGTVYCKGLLTVNNNTAATRGGGIFTEGSTINIDGGSDIKNNTATGGNGGGIYLYKNEEKGTTGTVTFSAGTNTIGGASSSAKNTAANGAGIYVDGGTVNFNAVSNVTYNEATTLGGGIAINAGTVNVAKTVDVANNSAVNGGGLALTGGKLVVKCTTSTDSLKIHDHTITGNGGGVYISDASISNTYPRMTVYKNTAANGGGIFATGADTISNLGMVRNNTATSTSSTSGGGGILNEGTTSITNTAVIKENIAQRGGGIYTKTGSLSLGAATITANTGSVIYGGGIYLRGGSLSLAGTTVTANESSDKGGGIYVYDGTLTFATTASTIGNSGNANRSVDGAGLYIQGGTVTCAVAPTVSYNVASGDGGGIYYNKGTLTLTAAPTVAYNEATGNGGGIYWNRNTTLSIADGKIAVNNNKAANGGGIYHNAGTLTINAVNINNNYITNGGAGGGIYKTSDATLTLNGTTLAGNYETHTGDYGSGSGAGVYVEGGTATLTGCTISGSHGTYSGGGLCVNDGTVGVVNTTIKTSSNVYSGGGIYIGGGTLNFSTTKSTIGGASSSDKNEAYEGGGLYVAGGTVNFDVAPDIKYNEAYDGAGLHVYGGTVNFKVAQTISNNTASGNGGGMYYYAGTLGFTGALTLQNNTAGYGGGLYTDGTISIPNGKLTLTGNTATSNGGGLYVKTGTTTLNGTTIKQNTATGNGGGVYVTGGGLTFATAASTIGGSGNDNRALNGGGLYVNGGAVTFTVAPTVSYNKATGDGGGIYLGSGAGTITFTQNPTVGYNVATGNGGGIYTAKTISPASGFTLSNNKAGNGGGIYVNAGTTTLVNATFAKDTATSNGGAVYLNGGGLTFNTTASTIGGSADNKNTAVNGAGIYVNAGTVTFTKGATVSYNNASGYGGGL
ncbi:MAG: hypothetical protein J5606_07815, partial [Bacteroidales bacterium]|nr:hypothetical protein [Bacteroidales bacterium]